MSEFTRVGKTDDFPRGRGRAVRVGDRKVAVFRIGEEWFAVQDACPHMGASLADGKLDGKRVICHWHHWKFDLHSGQGDQRSWARAAVYQVRVEGDEVFLRAPDDARTEAPAKEHEEEWIAWDPDRFFKKRD